MNEVVKYNNKLNLITFRNFLASDCDYFMFLCYKLNEKKESTIQVTFLEIRETVNLRNISNSELEEALLNLNDKLLATTGRIKDGSITKQFVLFNEFETDCSKQILTVSVNEKYSYILNDFSDGFTKFEFQEFMLLSGKHSKTLYRLLKQWRTQGKYIVNVDELKRIMDCPGMETKYFMRDAVRKSIKELKAKECFKDLEVTTKRDRKPNGSLNVLTFTFAPEPTESRTNPNGATPAPAPAAETKAARKGAPAPDPRNRFNNFQQRTYDFDELERRLQTR